MGNFPQKTGAAAIFNRKVSGGFKYYANYGRLGAFDTLHNQQQQFFIVTDLNEFEKQPAAPKAFEGFQTQEPADIRVEALVTDLIDRIAGNGPCSFSKC